jgi:hypothetical protein
MKLDPMLEEALVATISMFILGVFIALTFYVVTGISPWPFVILSECAAFGMGIALLTFASPRQRRP